MRKCKRCGAVMPPKAGPGRPREVCEACKPSRVLAAVPAEVVGAPARSDEPLIAATRKTLVDAGRLDTVPGQMALVLAARMLDRMNTGSSVASLSRELRATLDEALAGAVVEADPVVDFSARRAARAAGQ